MNLMALWDPASALVVVGGTALASVLRSGRGELRDTLRALAGLTHRGFDFAAHRAEIAGQVHDIRAHGILRTGPSPSTDQEIMEATAMLVRKRSIPAAIDTHERHKARRMHARGNAVRTLLQTAELAPVFGLAGTLLALSQLSADGLGRDALMGAVATAVVSTLYGLALAHLLVLPLARKVERAGEREEVERQRLMDWMAGQLETACPDARAVRPAERAA